MEGGMGLEWNVLSGYIGSESGSYDLMQSGHMARPGHGGCKAECAAGHECFV